MRYQLLSFEALQKLCSGNTCNAGFYLLLLALSFHCSAVRADSRADYWWIDAKYDPDYRGTGRWSPGIYDRTFVAASFLQVDDMPDGGVDLESVDAALELMADWDNDGEDEIAKVGVYLDNKGRTGRFLAILKANGDGPEGRIEFVQRFDGPPGFAALARRDDGLLIMFCLDCAAYWYVTSPAPNSYLVTARTQREGGNHEPTGAVYELTETGGTVRLCNSGGESFAVRLDGGASEKLRQFFDEQAALEEEKAYIFFRGYVDDEAKAPETLQEVMRIFSIDRISRIVPRFCRD